MIFGEYTDVYLYREQLKDHHSGLDLMAKQLVLELRLKVLALRVYLSNVRFNRNESWRNEYRSRS